jgi:hypothetical protein
MIADAQLVKRRGRESGRDGNLIDSAHNNKNGERQRRGIAILGKPRLLRVHSE